jgi:hypothetical protein
MMLEIILLLYSTLRREYFVGNFKTLKDLGEVID